MWVAVVVHDLQTPPHLATSRHGFVSPCVVLAKMMCCAGTQKTKNREVGVNVWVDQALRNTSVARKSSRNLLLGLSKPDLGHFFLSRLDPSLSAKQITKNTQTTTPTTHVSHSKTHKQSGSSTPAAAVFNLSPPHPIRCPHTLPNASQPPPTLQ